MSRRLMPARRSRKPNQHATKIAQSGKWTEEEDERLLMGIEEYGDDWLSISSKSVRTRTASQCSSRCGRLWSPEEDMSLERGHSDHGAKWPLISKLYVRSRSAEQCSKRWKLRHAKRCGQLAISSMNVRSPVADNTEAPTQGAIGPGQCYAENTTQALGLCSPHANASEDVRAAAGDFATERPLALDVSFTELDLCTLGELGLITPQPTETLTTFRQREAENLVKLARGLNDLQKSRDLEQKSIYQQVEEHERRLNEIHKTWNCDQRAVLERVEKHTHMFEDGFSQLKGLQQALNVLSRQPVPAIPEEKLKCLTSAVDSSLNRIRALEATLSHLQGLFEVQAWIDKSVPMTNVPPKPYSQPFAHPPSRGHTQPQATQKPQDAPRPVPSLTRRVRNQIVIFLRMLDPPHNISIPLTYNILFHIITLFHNFILFNTHVLSRLTGNTIIISRIFSVLLPILNIFLRAIHPFISRRVRPEPIQRRP
ncbi:hypothetical protein PM082_012425 [Marasmius tenuissimus]|nr:hypothetical protein PM082_012425 [Marasmius tenuissimus]